MSRAHEFLGVLLSTGKAIHPSTGRDMTDEICLAMQEIREEEELAALVESRGQGQRTSVRSRTGLAMVSDMPAVLERRIERDLGQPGALKDAEVRKTLAKFHPEFFPKEGYARRVWTGAGAGAARARTNIQGPSSKGGRR
jgi:hypothetical protein